MRAALVLALVLLPAAAPNPARAAIRPTQAEVVVADARSPGAATLDLDLKDGRRTTFHLACRSDGPIIQCLMSRKGQTVATARLDPNAALRNEPRQMTCQTAGVLLTLSASDLIQTQPAPIADSYHFRVEAAPAGRGAAPACPAS